MRLRSYISKCWPRSWGYLPHKLWDLHLGRRLINRGIRIKMRRQGYHLLGGKQQANRNGVFDIYHHPGRKEIIKIPRRDDYYSYYFWDSLRDASQYEKYRKILLNACQQAHIGEHVVAVNEVFRSGGYISPYIDGFLLADLGYSLDSALVPVQDVLDALDDLECSLTVCVGVGMPLSGDWELHNLLFDPGERRIINVDVEGFYSFAPGRRENQLNRICQNIEDVRRLLLKLSGTQER